MLLDSLTGFTPTCVVWGPVHFRLDREPNPPAGEPCPLCGCVYVEDAVLGVAATDEVLDYFLPLPQPVEEETP